MTRRRFAWLGTGLRLLGGGVFPLAFCLGCGGPSGSSPTAAAVPSYPPGWRLWELPCGARAPIGPTTVLRDQALTSWYEKGFARFPKGFDTSGAWSCQADSWASDGLQFSTVRVQLAKGGPNSVVADIVGDTFAMIGRRSPDMTEVEAPGAAGGGYGQGKAYQADSARVFVRVGTTSSHLYVVIVRGDGTLDAANTHLRAFLDGFAPTAR